MRPLLVGEGRRIDLGMPRHARNPSLTGVADPAGMADPAGVVVTEGRSVQNAGSRLSGRWLARLAALALAWVAVGVGFGVGAAVLAKPASAADFQAGDHVLTAQEEVELGFKNRAVAMLKRGTELTITEVRDPWIGGKAVVDGETVEGWVHKMEIRRVAVELGELPTVTDEKSAAEALAKFGATVEKDDEEHVLGVDATNTGLTDVALPWLRHFPKLNILQLGGTAITDAGMGELAGLKSLEFLYLDRTDITDAKLEALAGLENLVVLVLERTRVSGAGLAKLKGLGELRTLNLAFCSVTDDQLAACLEFPNLEVATLNKTGMKGPGLKHLRPLEKLRVLNISDNPVDEQHLALLSNAPTLKMLYVRGFKTTDETIQALKDTLISCAVYR